MNDWKQIKLTQSEMAEAHAVWKQIKAGYITDALIYPRRDTVGVRRLRKIVDHPKTNTLEKMARGDY